MSCDNKNPLQRNGTSQQQRMPEALKEGYVQVDERDYKEWIEFAGQFAKWINYIDKTNKVNGNWQPFFGSDISAVLGTIAIQDIDEYRRSFKERFDMLRADKNKPKTDLLKETFNELFGGIFTLCIALDTAAKKLPDNNPLKEIIQNLVRTQLENGFRQLLEIYKGASMAGLVKNNPSRDWIILNKQVLNPSAILAQEQLSELWIKKASTLSDYYNAVSLQANTEIYGTGSELYQKIHHIVNHNLFTGIFDQFLKAYTRIINDAEKLLMKTLTRWNDHTPHYTLFLAFLKLFRYSKAGINSITQRHLDFYYKEVLRLTHRAEIPDHAHLIMELAKQVNEYMLDKGTLFKAGKDSQGKDLVYALDKDTVFNKATVAALMNVYEGDDNDTTEDKVTSKKIMNAGRLFAAGTANSQDGKGAELKSLNKEWHPFFIKTYKEGKLTSIDTPHAQVGFAVASHYLYLTEGERTIDLTMEFANTYKFSPNATTFECYATTEKGWYLIKVNEVFHGTNSSGKLYYTIRFILKGNEPAITNYMAAVHGGSFDCKLPVIKIYLTNNDTITYPYDLLRNLEMNAIKVKVTVGNTNAYSQLGLKQLSVTNDVGLVDTSKPFQPFGALPTAASSLIIGNKELFCKKNAAMTLNIEWKDLPGNKHNIVFKGGTPPRVTVKHLANGTWIKDLDTTLFDGITERVKVAGTGGQPITVADQTIVDFADAYLPYDGKSNKGFLKLSLEKGFGNDAYQNARIIYLINLAKKTNGPAPPAPPYTPLISSLYISYTASTESDLQKNIDVKAFGNRTVRYFHLYPFGEAEQHAYLNNGTTKICFLPQFTHAEGVNDSIPDVASFFIGLKDLYPQQGVSMLFQVMEGSSDPTLSVTGTLIHWSYLSGNRWKPFDDQSVVDQSRSLRQSGIIAFQVPEDATLKHTMMPTGLIWFKASVSAPNKPTAVCKLLSIATQAAAINFVDLNNAPDFLTNALPANTITKLKDPVAAIKKISQPYPSFGGKPVETSSHFYMRINERLRHKDRAVTIWDYERLVLEAFPEIHRVKCLNHTKYINKDYNEVAPGYVTVITIPDLINHNEINPLRPYTNADTLLQIKEFLQKRISCHVQLNVCNPIFEEVMLEFNLKLLSGYEFSYYSNLLKESITAFLSPWAYGKSDDLRFGVKIEKSVLIGFIENQYYVDYIADVKMYHLTENNPAPLNDENEIMASKAVSVLVSVPANRHKIFQIPDSTAKSKKTVCKDEYNSITYEKN